ncbi:RNA polymerase subunit sigma-24 [Clostridium sp. LBM24168]|uniref:RNA polymerase subunit sigma-24 n=1 Tax=Clostridium tyrobutyricum TaxID=1519 RepID=UPI0030CBC9F3
MNKKELSQLYYLNREIEQLKSRIEELECIAVSDTSRITGMPHVTGISDKVGRYVAEIADLKELLNLNLKKCFYELNRLNRYIESIDDSQMRMIMTLRYVNGLSWRQIAFSIGGGNTEDSIKKLAYRYLKKN